MATTLQAKPFDRQFISHMFIVCIQYFNTRYYLAPVLKYRLIRYVQVIVIIASAIYTALVSEF